MANTLAEAKLGLDLVRLFTTCFTTVVAVWDSDLHKFWPWESQVSLFGYFPTYFTTNSVRLGKSSTEVVKSKVFVNPTSLLLECAVGQLAKGLRRDFLESNPDYWHRNAMGPWAKVIQISMKIF